jgi:hypothetical protein
MKTLFRFFCFVLFVSGWSLAAAALHVVRAPDPKDAQASVWRVFPKSELSLWDTYADLRTWKFDDLSDHPDLVKRLKETGNSRLLSFLSVPIKPLALAARHGVYG